MVGSRAPRPSWAAGPCSRWPRSPGIARYDTVLFSMHVVQHVLLGMVAPVLIVAGAPPLPWPSRRAGRAPRGAAPRPPPSGGEGRLTHPAFAAVAFTGTPFVLYLTPLYEATLRNGCCTPGCTSTSSSPGACGRPRCSPSTPSRSPAPRRPAGPGRPHACPATPCSVWPC